MHWVLFLFFYIQWDIFYLLFLLMFLITLMELMNFWHQITLTWCTHIFKICCSIQFAKILLIFCIHVRVSSHFFFLLTLCGFTEFIAPVNPSSISSYPFFNSLFPWPFLYKLLSFQSPSSCFEVINFFN